MGGPGSGNRYHGWRGRKKSVVEDCVSIDTNKLTRGGLLRSGVHQTWKWRWTYHHGQGFSVQFEVQTQDMSKPRLRLSYSWMWTSTRQTESLAYDIRLTTTRPKFGGLRWWFVCPLVRGGRPCNRRIGKLYLPPLARYFGCRDCHELTYTSCQESHKHSALARFLGFNSDEELEAFRTVKRLFGKLN